MAAAASSQDQFHYTENGITRGPLTIRQIRDLARAGQIQAQTLVWKEGYPGWVPAGSVKGLLPPTQVAPGLPPRVSSVPTGGGVRPGLPPALPDELSQPPQTRFGLLLCVLAAAVLVLGGTVVLVIVLLNNSAGDKSQTDEDNGKDRPVNVDKTPDKKDSTHHEESRPPEFKAPELLEKYDADPRKTLAELEGKTIIVKVEGNWEVEDLKKCIVGNDLIIYFFKTANRNLDLARRGEVMQLIFPLSGKDKISFFAKVKGRAEKLKKGEIVVWSLKGKLATFTHKTETFLLLKDTTLE
jgi:hypothetical protein